MQRGLHVIYAKKRERMRRKNSYMKNSPEAKSLVTLIALFLFGLFPLAGMAQTGEATVDALVEMGFENVGWTEDNDERVYVLQNSTFRAQGVGVGKAVDVIQRMGLPRGKACRIIVLDNNVPQVSLTYRPAEGDSLTSAERRDWEVSSDLGGSWKKVRKVEKKNSSLFKVDIVVYPDLKLRNLIITQIYEVLFNLSPAIEVSLWPGMKFIGQVIFPIVNEYGYAYEQIRQGYITLSQSIRLPYNIFLTATVGTFNNDRWGGQLDAKYIFKDERFTLEGSVGLTGRSRFRNWRWKVSPLKRLTWSVGAGFYWPQFNTQFSLNVEQYLLSEKGIQFQMVRNFRYASIGFYAMKVQHAGNKGYNGGFRFQIALPPYKYKRRGYIPRVLPSEYWGMSYNAGNERYYGRSFNPRLDENIATENSFNPYYIRNELLNF